MFGNKLRSWMEAVRPKRKHNKKDKQLKCNNALLAATPNSKCQTPSHQTILRENERSEINLRRADAKHHPVNGQQTITNSNSNHLRYSANNLSSPESAYSTGYSTDGTSPGAGVPPDYMHITTRPDVYYTEYAKPLQTLPPTSPCITRGSNTSVGSTTSTVISKLTPNLTAPRTPILSMNSDYEDARRLVANRGAIQASIGLTSPRQRNRIRTNPWLPGGTPSPDVVRHEIAKTPVKSRTQNHDSPRARRYLSPAARRRSLSSSSCSSLSGASLHWGQTKQCSIRTASDEEECTLNEMMGKYDESYVYEKETDILSDSDPTDCETDIDTGQDGGDEDDLLEVELDFIDNGSNLDFDPRPDYTGHCSYYNFDVKRKISSRRRTTRKSKPSEKRKRSSPSKKRHKPPLVSSAPTYLGSKSAGATPVSSRRLQQRPVSKLSIENCLKKRSNSVSFCRPTMPMDKREEEADQKYKELIVEAEQMLRTIKTNGLSPKRLPGVSNKRIELLRTAECAAAALRSDNTTAKGPIPSSNRFSPKKNHITNFIISNSPILVRREWEMQAAATTYTPLAIRRKPNIDECKYERAKQRAKKHLKMPNHRLQGSSSSETENEALNGNPNCPQSEPVRRKVYKSGGVHGKQNLNHNPKSAVFDSTENLRQQVLLNTLANLKRNLDRANTTTRNIHA